MGTLNKIALSRLGYDKKCCLLGYEQQVDVAAARHEHHEGLERSHLEVSHRHQVELTERETLLQLVLLELVVKVSLRPVLHGVGRADGGRALAVFVLLLLRLVVLVSRGGRGGQGGRGLVCARSPLLLLLVEG